ncbi:hypothetical protein [Cellulomonas sp.]|uniref:hypothetical protein n=1 Tax=Cellulomonas sp. TaxID=40001 RepID=UPI002810E8B2|nr:hypothetical protein [Cellulomonas sp.]
MRRRATLAAAAAAALLVAAVAPAGATTSGRTSFDEVVTGALPDAGRCVTLRLTGDLTWTARRGPVVTRYADLAAEEPALAVEVRDGCGEPRGTVEQVGLVQAWPDQRCGDACAEPGVVLGAPADGTQPVAGAGGPGRVTGVTPRRTLLGAPLCLPVDVAARVRWSEGGTSVEEIVGDRVEVCVEG